MRGRVFGDTTVLMLKYAGKAGEDMKKFPVVWITFILLFSCQNEINEIVGEDPDLVITSGSEMALWIQRATANDGTSDDFLDMYSCGTVKLPVAITLNGAVRMINNEADKDFVRRIAESLETPLTLQVPFTVVSREYTENTVRSAEEFDMLKAMCTDSPDSRINCVQFRYPVEMFTYYANNQSNGSVTLNADQDFYEFINQIGNLRTSIHYPVIVMYATGEEIEVSTNSELIAAVKNGRAICSLGS